MRIRYTVPLKRKIIIDDHWGIPMQGGTLRVIEENGYAKALELTLERQPLEYSPQLLQHNRGEVVASITGRDHCIMLVKRQFEDAAAFLECIFDIELMTDEIDATYEGETPDEEARISIKGMSMGTYSPVLPLSFDMLTRALMAAEKHDAPRFEATLAGSARRAIGRQEFINSFRYSFLLIESLYGEGQFKKAGLQAALKASRELLSMVELAIKDVIPAKYDHNSDTARLLAAKPTASNVIDHLVEMRGFYFHGNVKRKDAWKPDRQSAAESLALLAISIVAKISMKAAGLMFARDLEQRHFHDAIIAGAKIVFEIKFRYRQPEETFDRTGQIVIKIPGTKVTPRSAFGMAQHFLNLFQEQQPVAALSEAECIAQETGEKVFHIKFNALKSEVQS